MTFIIIITLGKILLTGKPGIGKTTIFTTVMNHLKNNGFIVGGFVSKEVRCEGKRIGFEIEDIYTGDKGWLAKVNDQPGIRIGKYRVILNDLEKVGVNAINLALTNPQISLIGVDEIAPMELTSPHFKKAIIKCFNSKKKFLGTVHLKLQNSIKSWVETSSTIETIEIRQDNRDKIDKKIFQKVLQ